VDVGVAVKDKLNWATHWTVEKRDGDIDAYVEERMPGWMRNVVTRRLFPDRVAAKDAELREQFKAEVVPFEVVEWDGNMLMNVGINEMLELLMGAAATAYSNAAAYLGVGDSAAALNATHTDLQAAANKVYVAMNASYPSITAQTITFQSDFGAGVGTWNWLEEATFNGNNPPTAEMLNRTISNLGTKAAGATWTLSMAITIT